MCVLYGYIGNKEAADLQSSRIGGYIPDHCCDDGGKNRYQ